MVTFVKLSENKEFSMYDVRMAYPWFYSQELYFGPLKVYAKFDKKDELV